MTPDGKSLVLFACGKFFELLDTLRQAGNVVSQAHGVGLM